MWDLHDGFNELRERYPNLKEIIGSSTFDISFGASSEPTFDAEPLLQGLRYFSADGIRQFEARIDGFSFNHVSQQQGDYKGWESFAQEVESALSFYMKNRAPHFVTRIGLRYINRFDLSATPDEVVTISNFFDFHPLWNQQSLGEANGFQMKMAFHQKNEALLLISQETAPDESGEIVLLDIDAFFENLRLPAQETGELWRRAQELRVIKNNAFEACLTEQTRNLIR